MNERYSVVILRGYIFRLYCPGKYFDFLLKNVSVYIQYYSPVLTMFLGEDNDILVTYLDFR